MRLDLWRMLVARALASVAVATVTQPATVAQPAAAALAARALAAAAISHPVNAADEPFAAATIA